MYYCLVDIDIIKTWIETIKKYDYSKLAEDKIEKMSTVLTARREAYENVLNLIIEGR